MIYIIVAILIIMPGKINSMDLNSRISDAEANLSETEWNLFLNILDGKTTKTLSLLFDEVNFNVAIPQTKITPLHLAAFFGNYRLVCALIRRKAASINNNNDYVGTPLHCSVLNGHISVIKKLLEVGVDPNCQWRTLFNCAPLHIAAYIGSGLITEELLQKGAYVDARTNPGGLTPFHISTYYGKLEVMRVLIQANANFMAKDGSGRIPLDLADTDETHGYLLSEYLRKTQPTTITNQTHHQLLQT